MRFATALIGLTLGTSWAASAEPPQVVYLDGPAAVEQLRVTHPAHYARAQRIIAASNELCRPGRATLLPTWLDAREVSCAAMLLRTSNPPKQQITFRLDEVRYIALVSITDDPPRLRPAD